MTPATWSSPNPSKLVTPVTATTGPLIPKQNSFLTHIHDLRTKAERIWGSLWKIKSFYEIPKAIKYMIYSQLIRSFITYGSSSWSVASEGVLLKIQQKENKLIRKLVGAKRGVKNSDIKSSLNHIDITQIMQNVRKNELQKLEKILETF